jgi:two-component system, chemotaxis family, sensor kinase Cph1
VRRITAPETDGREIEWRIADLPPAWGDPTMLRQALLNLVGNAIKYTKRQPKAVISMSGESVPGGVTYTISDNGVGFEMAYVGKLFGVFQRLHRTEDFEGTGIGLALTRRIIERHGGRIEAEGQVGAGATFRFTLPKKGKEGSLG